MGDQSIAGYQLEKRKKMYQMSVDKIYELSLLPDKNEREFENFMNDPIEYARCPPLRRPFRPDKAAGPRK